MGKVIINPDWGTGEVKDFIKDLKENDGYCPCRIQRSEDNKCKCKEFMEQESGECHCGFYVKVEGG